MEEEEMRLEHALENWNERELVFGRIEMKGN